MQLKNEQMDRLKQTELEMFKEFIRVCEELHLRYYVIGGTLLGAVRHQGFIPWDDDIDVGMPREDYEAFKSKAQAVLSSRYFVQDRETDPELPNNFMKIRDNNTTFVESSVKHRRINHGVYIDIFPLDYYPDGKWAQKWVDARKALFELLIMPAFGARFKPQGKNPKEWVKKILVDIAGLKYPTPEAALAGRDKLYRSVKKSSLLANYGGAWGKKEIMPAAWFAEGSQLAFEGLRVNGPKEYVKYLTNVYGDYLQLPPEEKRVTHHYTEVIDLDKPYTEYVGKDAQ